MDGDLEKATLLLKDIRDKCKDATNHVNDLCKKAENGEFSTSKGISFLEVKYQMLLSYLINLTYVMLKKSHGGQIQGDGAIDRLVEIRTVLEKMRPIDQKLKYQIDKIIRLAATGGSGSNDPMRFKANPDSLESKIDDEGSESGSETDQEDEDDKPGKVYRPPKLAAVHYDGDETLEDKRQKQVESLRKRALNSDVMQELKQQYYEGPEEIQESRDIHRLKGDKKAKNRTRYEEENFVRLSVSKKEKHATKRLATMSSLNTLANFDSISALDMEEGNMEGGVPAKKRKAGGKGSKGKKGKKGFKKKRRH